jgi:hypothetical protein
LSFREGVAKHLFAVIPAKAGIHQHLKPMDSCLRRNDGKVEILHDTFFEEKERRV